MQGDGPRLSSRPWNNEYDGFAKSFFAKKERFQLLIRVFDIAPYNMEGALLPEYESGSLRTEYSIIQKYKSEVVEERLMNDKNDLKLLDVMCKWYIWAVVGLVIGNWLSGTLGR